MENRHQLNCLPVSSGFINRATIRSLAVIEGVYRAALAPDGRNVTLIVDPKKVENIVNDVRELGLQIIWGPHYH